MRVVYGVTLARFRPASRSARPARLPASPSRSPPPAGYPHQAEANDPRGRERTCARLLPRSSRRGPATRAAPPLVTGELEENPECEGEGAAPVEEVARLAEIGLRVGQQ